MSAFPCSNPKSQMMLISRKEYFRNPSIKTEPLTWKAETKLARLKDVVLRTQVLDGVFNTFLARLCARRGTIPYVHDPVTSAIVHVPKEQQADSRPHTPNAYQARA